MFLLKSFIKLLIPLSLRFEIKGIFRSFLYRGNNVFCLCCKGQFKKFLPAVITKRPAECPKCGSLERHRMLWIYWQEKTNLFSKKIKLLHIAPEYILQKLLRSMPNIDYLSADLNSILAMEKIDITNMPYKDNFFDVIICNHVLEHIKNDHQALKELYRTLRPGGWATLQSALDPKLSTTCEDSKIVSLEDRLHFYGQEDHWRKYGQDYKNRIADAGFIVKIDSFIKNFNTEQIKKYGLNKEEYIYIGFKK